MYMWLISRVCIALIYVHGCIREEEKKTEREAAWVRISKFPVLHGLVPKFFMWTPGWSGTRPIRRASGACTAYRPFDRWQNKKNAKARTQNAWTVLRLYREVYGAYLLKIEEARRKKKCCRKIEILQSLLLASVAAVHWLIIEDDKMLLRTVLAVLLAIVVLVSSQGSQVRASSYSPASAGVEDDNKINRIFCFWQSSVAG